MPQTALRLPDYQPGPATPVAELWAGELRGEVGAMHRAIEERLLSSPDLMAVVALPRRPGDVLAATLSRYAGWAMLGIGFVCTVALVLRLAR